jgi:hypothetical protein
VRAVVLKGLRLELGFVGATVMTTSVSYFDYRSFQKQRGTGGDGRGGSGTRWRWRRRSSQVETGRRTARRRTSGAAGRVLHEMDGSPFGDQIILFVIS